MSQLRKYIPDPDHTLVFEPIEITGDLVYGKRPVQMLDRRIKQLRNKQISLVKVLWSNHTSQEATREAEAEMKVKYQYLFEVTFHDLVKFLSFKDKNL